MIWFLRSGSRGVNLRRHLRFREGSEKNGDEARRSAYEEKHETPPFGSAF